MRDDLGAIPYDLSVLPTKEWTFTLAHKKHPEDEVEENVVVMIAQLVKRLSVKTPQEAHIAKIEESLECFLSKLNTKEFKEQNWPKPENAARRRQMEPMATRLRTTYK